MTDACILTNGLGIGAGQGHRQSRRPVTDELPLLGFGLPVSGQLGDPGHACGASPVGPRSSGTRRCGPSSACSTPSTPSSARRTARCSTRSSRSRYVAGHTDRIGLGTATVCAPFTAPALLAKALTSLDVLSGGRLTVGLGSGWLPQEYAAAGVPFERRGARMEEYLRCLQALWTQDPVEFAGEFYTVPRSHVGPPPVQRPHPPILLGGTAPAALRRAGRLAQGWIAGSQHDLTRIGADIATVRDGAREAGRDPQALRILVRLIPQGTREHVLNDLKALHEEGRDRGLPRPQLLAPRWRRLCGPRARGVRSGLVLAITGRPARAMGRSGGPTAHNGAYSGLSTLMMGPSA